MMDSTQEFLDRDSDPGKRQGGTIVPGTPRSWVLPKSNDGQSGSCSAGESVATASAKGATQPSVRTEGQPRPSGTALMSSSGALPSGASSRAAPESDSRPSSRASASLSSVPLSARMALLADAGMTDAALTAKLSSDASSLPETAALDAPPSPRAQLLHIEQDIGWGPEWTEGTPSTTSGSRHHSRRASPARSLTSTAISAPPPPDDVMELSSSASSASEDVPLPCAQGRGTKRGKRAATTVSHRTVKRGRKVARDDSSEGGELPLPVPLYAATTQAAKPSRLHLRKQRAIAAELGDFAGRMIQQVGAEMLTWVQECETMRSACTNLPGEGSNGGISGRLRVCCA